MGTQDAEINALAAVRQPLFICGEPGTGKEQIARYLYLHSALVNRPLVVANCAMMNDKSWDFLLNHYNSPLNANGNTVYFQNFEAIPEQWSTELLAAIEETGLARRIINLIFLCKKTTSLHIFYLYAMRSRFLTYLLFNLHTEK